MAESYDEGDAFDDDLFDAEVILGRTGITNFDAEGIAAVLGFAERSIWRHMASGRIPAPDHYEGDGIFQKGIWTKDQVIRMVAHDLASPVPSRDHGTEFRYRKHLRDGDKPCDLCKRNHSARRKEFRHDNKAQQVSA